MSNTHVHVQTCKVMSISDAILRHFRRCLRISGTTLVNGRELKNYRNDPKFSDRYARANSADPAQTVPRGAVCSGSTLFAIPSASFGLITLW